MHRVDINARDLRILDPLLSYPSTILGRERVIVLNLEDYYKILEVDYNASEETIRSSYIRLALKWHPDKKQGEENSTSKFQEINEAYQGSRLVGGVSLLWTACRYGAIPYAAAGRRWRMMLPRCLIFDVPLWMITGNAVVDGLDP